MQKYSYFLNGDCELYSFSKQNLFDIKFFFLEFYFYKNFQSLDCKVHFSFSRYNFFKSLE